MILVLQCAFVALDHRVSVIASDSVVITAETVADVGVSIDRHCKARSCMIRSCLPISECVLIFFAWRQTLQKSLVYSLKMRQALFHQYNYALCGRGRKL